MLILNFVAVLLVLVLLIYVAAQLRFGGPWGCENSGCYIVPANSFIYITQDNNQILCPNPRCPGPHVKRRLKVINHTDQPGFVIGYKAGHRAGASGRLASLDARIEEFNCETCTYVDTGRLKKVRMSRECNEQPC